MGSFEKARERGGEMWRRRGHGKRACRAGRRRRRVSQRSKLRTNLETCVTHQGRKNGRQVLRPAATGKDLGSNSVRERGKFHDPAAGEGGFVGAEANAGPVGGLFRIRVRVAILDEG